MGFSKLAFLVLLVEGCLSAVYREPRSLNGNEDGQTDAETRSLPSQGFVMNIWMFYDKTFSSKFGSAAESRIKGSFVEVRKVFAYPSLGTIIRPVIKGISKFDDVMTVSDNDSTKFERHVATILDDADAYVLLTYGGTTYFLSLAALEATCSRKKERRTGILKYDRDDTYTGNAIAEVLANNLGMQDGIPKPGTTKWPSSSVDDFTKYYESNQPFCLKLIPRINFNASLDQRAGNKEVKNQK